VHEPRTPFRFEAGTLNGSEPAKSQLAGSDTAAAESRVAWRVAVRNQLPDLMRAHNGRYPGHEDALKWFKANDREGVFIRDDNADGFTWLMDRGKRAEGGGKTTKKTASIQTFRNFMKGIIPD
jgi:hypothetical protein